MPYKQKYCFDINEKFWKLLGVHPKRDLFRYYNYYSKLIVFLMVILYVAVLTINFNYLPRQIDIFTDEMIFYFMEQAMVSKVLTFLYYPDKILKILMTLESNIFQPDTDEGIKIINKAEKFSIMFLKIVTVVSVISVFTNIRNPLILHVFLSVKLELPISSYSFFSENTTQKYIYPLYLYQGIGMHLHMLYNLNIDTFFLGLMIFVIAQLDILDIKLRNLTNNLTNDLDREQNLTLKLKEAINHYNEVAKFCKLVQDVFSVTLFIQFSMASCIICVCLFRFTLPATANYLVFLATYLFVMVIQILVPCWYGAKIVDKSCMLSAAIYSCNWTPKSKRFKKDLKIFVDRLNLPIKIVGGKMFILSLETFTSIINSAYSFYTLLRNMQTN